MICPSVAAQWHQTRNPTGTPGSSTTGAAISSDEAPAGRRLVGMSRAIPTGAWEIMAADPTSCAY
jgi:hypothetical protein